MKKLHPAVWLVAGCCALSLSCDNGSSTTTTPTPAPPPPAPPPPPPAPEPPAVPTGLQVSAHGQDFIEWSWDAVEGADGYDVLFSLDEMIDLTDDIVSRTADETSYRREELPAGSGATLRVRSASGMDNDRLTSEWSDHVAGMTLPPPPADVAGDWHLVYEPAPPPSVEPSDGCFVTEWWNATRGTGEPQMEPDRVIQIEQDGETLSGYAWVLEEGQEPTGLNVEDAGWRLVGTATPDAVSLSATDRRRMGEWDPYPYSAGEFPTAQFLQGKCPEYGEATIQIQAAGAEWEMNVQEDGSVSGEHSVTIEWKIGDLVWTETQGPTPFTATRVGEE